MYLTHVLVLENKSFKNDGINWPKNVILPDMCKEHHFLIPPCFS